MSDMAHQEETGHTVHSSSSSHREHHVSLNSYVHVRLRNTRLWLLLDHPPLNKLTVEMLEQVNNALQRITRQTTQQNVQQSAQPTLLVLTSLGEEAFCEGIDAPDTLGDRKTRLEQLATTLCASLEILRGKGIPTVALVKGNAFDAGCELLSLCDTVIARDDARFRLPAPDTHIFPCSLPTYLPAAPVQQTATRLAQEQKTVSASEALSLGLVHQVLPTSRFRNDAEELLVMLSTLAQHVEA